MFDFESIPDDTLIKLAQKDWPSLVLLCWAYSIDAHFKQEHIINPKPFIS